jgi:hypothetical protein
MLYACVYVCLACRCMLACEHAIHYLQYMYASSQDVSIAHMHVITHMHVMLAIYKCIPEENTHTSSHIFSADLHASCILLYMNMCRRF